MDYHYSSDYYPGLTHYHLEIMERPHGQEGEIILDCKLLIASLALRNLGMLICLGACRY
jgi:hypothetical protein